MVQLNACTHEMHSYRLTMNIALALLVGSVRVYNILIYYTYTSI